MTTILNKQKQFYFHNYYFHWLHEMGKLWVETLAAENKANLPNMLAWNCIKQCITKLLHTLSCVSPLVQTVSFHSHLPPPHLHGADVEFWAPQQVLGPHSHLSVSMMVYVSVYPLDVQSQIDLQTPFLLDLRTTDASKYTSQFCFGGKTDTKQ